MRRNKRENIVVTANLTEKKPIGRHSDEYIDGVGQMV